MCSYLQQYCTSKVAITLSKFISAKHKEAREIAIQMLHTLGPRKQVSDGSVYRQISAIYKWVPDEFGYSNQWSQNLDRKPKSQDSLSNLEFSNKSSQVTGAGGLRMLPAHNAVCSRAWPT